MLVYLLCRHLEEERLNTAARAGAYERIFPLEVSHGTKPSGRYVGDVTAHAQVMIPSYGQSLIDNDQARSPQCVCPREVRNHYDVCQTASRGSSSRRDYVQRPILDASSRYGGRPIPHGEWRDRGGLDRNNRLSGYYSRC